VKNEKAKKPTAAPESRMPDWAAQVVNLKKEFVAYEESIAIQQEMLKAIAIHGKQWGLDLELVTQMSRDAFDRIIKAIEGDATQDTSASKKGNR
jgi:hypothetical protein